MNAKKLQEAEKILRETLLFPEAASIVPEGENARIQVCEEDCLNVWFARDCIIPAVREAGFSHVSLDLEGGGGKLMLYRHKHA